MEICLTYRVVTEFGVWSYRIWMPVPKESLTNLIVINCLLSAKL